jgi:rhomboid protease GluP
MEVPVVILYCCAVAVVMSGTRVLAAFSMPEGEGAFGPHALREVWLRQRPYPLLSAVAVLAMAVLALAQSAFPGLVPQLERAPGGPWWRVLTALLVQSSGWVQILFNLAALIAVAPVAERQLGRLRWLLVYLGSGTAANAVSAHGWSPLGGGDSTAICGLAGALAMLYARRGRHLATRRLALVLPAAGVVLCALADNHGVGLLCGCGLGAVLAGLPGPAGQGAGAAPVS